MFYDHTVRIILWVMKHCNFIAVCAGVKQDAILSVWLTWHLNDGQAAVPSRACKVVLHCCSRSPGSDVGKNTAAESPATLPEKSNRKPTADRRACHPGTPQTLPRGEETHGRERRRQALTFKDKERDRPALRPYSPRFAAMCTLGYTGHSECAAKTSQSVERDRDRDSPW